jgi:hypothetical protein
LGSAFSREHSARPQEDIESRKAEDGDISFREEALGDTERMGMANIEGFPET